MAGAKGRSGGARPGAGRKKGSSPRVRQNLLDTVRKAIRQPDFDPVHEMARIGMDEAQEIGIRLQALKEVAQYIAPKLKSVDMNIQGDMNGEMVIRWAQPKD